MLNHLERFDRVVKNNPVLSVGLVFFIGLCIILTTLIVLTTGLPILKFLYDSSLTLFAP